MSAQVACRGARHAALQRQLGAGIDNVGRDVNRTRRLTAQLGMLRRRDHAQRQQLRPSDVYRRALVVGSLAAFVPAM